jgi:AhpD family alkylhydroperoxidase
MSSSIWEDFYKRRSDGNTKILEQDFTPFKRFFSVDTLCYQDGAVPVKYKELMGLAVSLSLRCKDCILYHIDKSLEAGATVEELNESMNIALVVAGSIVIPELRFALTAIEEKLKG